MGLLFVLFVVTVLAGIWAWEKASSIKEKQEVTWEDIAGEEMSTAMETQEEPQDSTESEESTLEEVIYEKPEYDFQTEEITVEVPDITKEYTIAWVSDLHMVTDHEVTDDIRDEDIEAVEGRYDFFQTGDGKHGDELLPDIVDFLNYGRYDGIIFGGDMLDYCSRSNMDQLHSQMERLNAKVPLLYIRADHDYGFWYGGDTFTENDAESMHKELADCDDLNTKYIDFGEFTIIGVNRSTKDMMQEQFAILENMLNEAQQQDKPVIIVTHVPYESKVDDANAITLYNKSMDVRNKVYYWGGGDYIPNETTQAFLDRIYDTDTNVVQVLAGHLHAGWDGKISEQVKQHIFEPAYLGTIGIIHVVPKED